MSGWAPKPSPFPSLFSARAAGAVATLAALALASSGCASAARHDPLPVAERDPADTARVTPARWPGFPLLPDGRFPIGGWCAPPVTQTTAARYEEYARAGFTVVMPALEDPYRAGPNLARLDVAGRCGLYVILRDIRVHPGVALRPGWRAAVDSVAATYAAHPAMLGYFLADEPQPDLFDALGAVVRRLAMRDSLHPAYINLLGARDQDFTFQGRTYSNYVQYFVEAVRPAVFSLDNYVLKQDGTDIPSFDVCWDSARLAAGDTPFWAVPLLTPHGEFRRPTEGELAWQANLALAHGARGIVWFTYWSPNPAEAIRYRGGPIAYDGSRNPSYEIVSRVNAAVGLLGQELGPLRCADVRHAGEPPRGGRRLGADEAARRAYGLEAKGTANLTLGLFLDPSGRRHVVVVNRDYRNPVTARLVSEAAWERWAGQPGRYAGAQSSRREIELRLEPGGAALLRAAPSDPRRPPR